MKDLTDLLKGSNSHVIQGVTASGGVVLGMKAPGFNGVLIEDREFSNRLSAKLEAEASCKGFISTDELPKYGLTKEDKQAIEQALEVGEQDVGIFVADKKETAEKAIAIVEKEIAGYKK